MLAVSKDYHEFLERAEAAEPQAAQALSQLQRAFEVVRMSPHFSMQDKVSENKETQAENKRLQGRS